MYGEAMAMSVAEVMGAEARTLRLGAGASLEDVAEAVRPLGLPWSTGRVGDFEAGRAAPDLRTLFVVAAALSNVIGRPISSAELFAGHGDVAITETVTVKRSVLRAMLSDKPVKMMHSSDVKAVNIRLRAPRSPVVPKGVRGVDPGVLHRVLQDSRESDLRMCQRIGVEPYWGAAAMAKLWGKTFVARRDELAGPDANPQRRGQVSRQLQAELRELLG